MLEVKNVSKTFKNRSEKKLVLDDVSVTVDKNEIVGIVGPSGCGKSTLARIICGTIKMDTGSIMYDGQPVILPTGNYNSVMRRKI